jgi:signal transduction histidine kinase
MNQQSLDRFQILHRVAVEGAGAEDIRAVADAALKQASALVGLHAAALHIWDSDYKPLLAVSHAETESAGESLERLESELFKQLRRDQSLVSAYMSFGGEKPYQSFTLPLRHGRRIFGAIIGLQEGEGRLVHQDTFLEALSATLALVHAATQAGQVAEPSDEALQKQKLSGIVETAVTVNHEINSPLTAILGNVQLLLRDAEQLDERLVAKLRTIEESAERIQRVTKKLLNVKRPRSIDYSDGIRMLDLSDESESEEGQ